MAAGSEGDLDRAGRLYRMAQMLQDRPFTTAELAERFGVSHRTIRRDLLILRGEPYYLPLECELRYHWILRRVAAR